MLKIELPIEGYEFDGVRRLNPGECYLNAGGEIQVWPDVGVSVYPRLALRRVTTYRNPEMPQDYGKEIEVNDHVGNWLSAVFCGYSPGSSFPYFAKVGKRDGLYVEARIKAEG